MKNIFKWLKLAKEEVFEILALAIRPEDALDFEDYNNHLDKHKKQIEKINKIKQGWE